MIKKLLLVCVIMMSSTAMAETRLSAEQELAVTKSIMMVFPGNQWMQHADPQAVDLAARSMLNYGKCLNARRGQCPVSTPITKTEIAKGLGIIAVSEVAILGSLFTIEDAMRSLGKILVMGSL